MRAWGTVVALLCGVLALRAAPAPEAPEAAGADHLAHLRTQFAAMGGNPRRIADAFLQRPNPFQRHRRADSSMTQV